MEKQLKLNFNINGTTVNGHRYDRKALLEAFKTKIDNKDLFVYLEAECPPNVEKLVGEVLSFEEKDGIIETAISLTNPDLYEKIVEGSKVTTCGIGKIKKDDVEVEEFELTHLALTNDEGDK